MVRFIGAAITQGVSFETIRWAACENANVNIGCKIVLVLKSNAAAMSRGTCVDTLMTFIGVKRSSSAANYSNMNRIWQADNVRSLDACHTSQWIMNRCDTACCKAGRRSNAPKLSRVATPETAERAPLQSPLRKC